MEKVKGTGKISKKKSGYSKSGRGGYEYVQIYVPSKISKDSTFPFEDKEEVEIEIKSGKLVISKKDEKLTLVRRYKLDEGYSSLPELIESKALENNKRPFLFFQDNIYSYLKIHEESNSIAHGILKILKELNINKRAHIAICLPNCPEFIISWFGIVKANCVFVPVSPYVEDDDLAYLLDISDSDFLITDLDTVKKFKKIDSELSRIKSVFVINILENFFSDKEKKKYRSFETLCSGSFENTDININPTDMMSIVFTEGTTGKPKSIVYKNFFVKSSKIFGESIKIRNRIVDYKKVVYCSTPLFQAFSQFIIVITSLYLNSTIALAEKFNASTFWDDVRKYNAELVFFYGGILQSLMDQPPKDIDRYHNARFAWGGQTPTELWEAFENRFKLTILEGWAATEAVGFIYNNLGSKGGKLGSMGKPLRGWNLKIIDDNGRELPSGTNNIGEIAVKSPFPTRLNYYKPPKNEPMIVRDDGYVLTGDLGYMDNDGFVFSMGRKTEIITKGNKKIYPFLIEKVANAHPSVLESAVFGIPTDQPNEEHIKICLVPKRGKKLIHKEMYEYLSENLAYYMIPRYIEMKDRLRNSSKRIKKYLLVNEFNDEKIYKKTWDSRTGKFLA